MEAAHHNTAAVGCVKLPVHIAVVGCTSPGPMSLLGFVALVHPAHRD